MPLDSLDKQLLNLIQTKFPIVSRPYHELAVKLGTTEEDILDRIKLLQEKGVIRRLGGIFDSRQVGYTGSLCALKVPTERIDEVARVINSYPGVTHNYIRPHEYNMWFTLLVETQEKLTETLEQIQELTGITDLLNLPAKKIFKIRVNFDLSEG